MDNAQVALKLLLDELGLQPDIRTVQERKTVQKAVYLGQASGVDLGYRYNWYIMGPYSPELTKDYFALGESLQTDDDRSIDYALQDPVKSRLARVKGILTPPEGVALNKPEWLELLASVHYLLRARNMAWSEAIDYLRIKKRHVAPYADRAHGVLENEGLIPAA